MSKALEYLEKIKEIETDVIDYAMPDYEAEQMGREISYNEIECVNSVSIYWEYFKEFNTIHKELEYADKCHNLEEQLGCPIDVVFKAINQGYIYALRSDELVKVNVNMLNFEDGKLKGCCFSQTTEIGNCLQCYKFENDLKDYKKTWWLKKDKSE